MIWVRRVGLLLLLLLLLVVGVIAYLTMTHGGMQRLFSLGKSYAQGELNWGESTGTLVGPATLADVLYVNDTGTAVQIDKAQFDWQPVKLLSRELHIDALEISGVTVRLPASSESAESAGGEAFQLQDLALPVAANITELLITDISIYPHGVDTPIVIDKILLSGGGRDDALSLVELSISAPQGMLKIDGNVGTSGNWPVALSSQWQYQHPQFGQFDGSGTIIGEIDALDVSHIVEGGASSGLVISLDTVVRHVTAEPEWDGKVTVSADDFGVFNPSLKDVPFKLVTNTRGVPSNYSAEGVLDTHHAASGPVSSEFAISGSLETLVIDKLDVVFTESTAVIDLQGNVALADLNSDVVLNWKEVNIPLNDLPALVQSPSGTVQFNGTPDEFSLLLETQLIQAEAGALAVNADVSGSTTRLVVNTVSIDSADGDMQLSASAVVDIENQNVDASGEWKDLRWPLVGAPAQVVSPAGTFSVVGPFDNYQLAASIELEQGAIPAGVWDFSANGSTESLRDIVLEGSTLDGTISATGTAGWKPLPGWQLELQGRGINPASQWKGRDGKIGFDADVSGVIDDNGPNIKALLSEVSGQYRQQKLNGSGEFLLQDGEITLNQFDVSAGTAVFKGNGSFGETMDVQWLFDAPSLGKLDPSLSGSVKVRGSLAGTASAPDTDIEIVVTEFSASGVQVKTLEGSGKIDLSGKSQSMLTIEASELVASGQSWQQLRIDGSGTPAKHKLEAALEGSLARVNLLASGGMKKQQWQGNIEQLRILKTDLGDWILKQPTAVVVSRDSAEAKSLCLSSEPTSVCVDATYQASNGITANLELDKLQAQRFAEFLPADIAIDVPLNGVADLKIDGDGKLFAYVEVTIPDGTITYEDMGEATTATLGASLIKANVSNDKLTSEVDIDLGKIGQVAVNAVVSGLSSQQRLSGSIKTRLQDLSLLGIAVPQLQAIDGTLVSDLTFNGSVTSPVVEGEARLENFFAEVPSVALKITDGALRVSGDGNGRLTVSGTARSGEGKLALDGIVEPKTGDLELAIVGEKFQVSNTKNQQVQISPDLQVNIVDSNISVTGDLLIPSAFINAAGGSGTLSESPDVVIVEADAAVPEKSAASRVQVAVNVKLGEDIRVKAGPFDGALSGGLLVEQQPGRVTTGSGAIDVISGDFLVYGQKLTMEKGRVLFSGGPIDDPALEMDVARDVTAYDVKAGARIRGTAQSPILELQSDPAQTDASTLSYILLGKPLGTAGASYTLGKFITPDIYISYGIDLFDKLQTFNLRYKISDRLSLNAASSKKSSADLIYTIER